MSKENTKKVELESAYVLPKETGDQLVEALLEMPMKYQPLLGKHVDALIKAYRGNISMDVPVQPPAAPSKEVPKEASKEKPKSDA